MPVSSSRVTFKDRQVKILVRDFTTIADSGVQNIDPGTVIPEGFDGISLLDDLLKLLEDAIRKNPFSILDGGILNFALKVLKSIITTSLGIYGQVIDLIRNGGPEIMALFSVALMREIATRPPTSITNPSNAYLQEVIKSTVMGLMNDQDFIYLLMSQPASKYTNLTTGLIPNVVSSVTSTASVVTPNTNTQTSPFTSKIDYSAYYVPYSQYELVSAKVPGYTPSPLSTVMSNLTSDIDDAMMSIQVYLSVVSLVSTQNTQAMLTPTLEQRVFDQYEAMVMHTTQATDRNTVLNNIQSIVNETVDEIYTTTRFWVDAVYAHTKVLTALCKNYQNFTHSGTVSYAYGWVCLYFNQLYSERVVSRMSHSLRSALLDTQDLRVKARTLINALVTNRSVINPTFIHAEVTKAMRADIFSCFKKLSIEAGFEKRAAQRAQLVSIVVHTYLSELCAASIVTADAAETQDEQVSKITLLSDGLALFFTQTNAYFNYTADATYQGVLSPGTRLIPYQYYYASSQLTTPQPLTGLAIKHLKLFLAHMLSTERKLTTPSLSETWESEMYAAMMSIRNNIESLTDVSLLTVIKTGSVTDFTSYLNTAINHRLVMNVLYLQCMKQTLPSKNYVEVYTSVDLERVTYNGVKNRITYI